MVEFNLNFSFKCVSSHEKKLFLPSQNVFSQYAVDNGAVVAVRRSGYAHCKTYLDSEGNSYFYLTKCERGEGAKDDHSF